MRESLFVKKNQSKWTTLEQHLSKKNKLSPAELANLYLELADDLNYARTFYPESQVYTYLNQLASSYHREVYQDKKLGSRSVLNFYLKEFPLMFYRYLPVLGIAFAVFSLFALIGAYSTHTENSFARAILGDAYINQTMENIKSGDPMAIYKSMNEVDMLLGITVNNIRVSVIAFVAGIFLGLGTVLVLLRNGVMVGSFQYFFQTQDLFWESARTIWIHGTIEISVIIVAGCAGMVLGKGMLFPGTFSRLASFQKGIKDGLKILVSTVPFFIVAGFLESFVTRYTQMPDWLSILIIAGSMSLILFYYVYLPYKLHKQTKLCNPILN